MKWKGQAFALGSEQSGRGTALASLETRGSYFEQSASESESVNESGKVSVVQHWHLSRPESHVLTNLQVNVKVAVEEQTLLGIVSSFDASYYHPSTDRFHR